MACTVPYAGVNLCLAIDMSGSVCSPEFSNPVACTDCTLGRNVDCQQTGFSADTCCQNFQNFITFANSVISNIDTDTTSASQFSVVSFSSDATTVTSPLVSDPASVQSDIQGITYAGGRTNHEAAIDSCQATFNGDTSGNENAILLITDGVSTTSTTGFDDEADAINAANVAMGADTYIRSVFVNPEPTTDALTFMETISTDNVVTAINDFDNLAPLIGPIVAAIGCRGVTNSPTPPPSVTSSPTSSPTPPSPNDPGSMDDPHIFTWKGIIYNYHGQCDLIYTTCPSFDNNKGLRIHMRTKFVMPEEWSTITNLAVQIGEDTFELQNDGTYHFNGEVNPALSNTANLAGHEMKQATRHNGHNFSIALGDGISLEVANYVRETRNSLAFKIVGVHDHRDNGGTSLSDCVGLTSTWDHPEDHRFLVGRSGTMYSAAKRVEFGPEWQVDRTKGDPMLFAEDVGQQLPDQRCIDSKDDLGHRRLLDDAEAEALGRQAEDACRHLRGRNKDLFEACVSDILVTGDVSFAEEPWYNGGDEF